MDDVVDVETTTDWKDKTAFLISALLSPFVLTPIFIVLVFAKYTSSFKQFLLYLAIGFFFSTVVPFLYVYFAVKKNKISDLHVANREERVMPFTVAILSIIVGTAVLYYLNAPRELQVLGVVMAFNGIIFFIITLFWKISMHSSVLASLLVALMVLINPDYALGFLLMPFMIWARMKRRRHNIYQGIAAVILAAVSSYAVFRMFGIPY